MEAETVENHDAVTAEKKSPDDNQEDDESQSSSRRDEDLEEDSDDNDDQHDIDSSSSSEADSDDESDDDVESSDDDNNAEKSKSGEGLSEYELLRQERIKRNKERLIQLGLESRDGGGVLGKKKKKPTTKRRTSIGSSTGNASAPARRSSRRSTGNVDYSEPPNSVRSMLEETGNVAATASNPSEERANKARKKEKPHEERIPRFIYYEFSAIKKHKKDMLKHAESNLRKSEIENKYWRKKAEVVEKRARRERVTKEENEVFGTSAYDFVRELERRLPEIHSNIQIYDRRHMSKEHQAEAEIRQQERDNKLKLLDALDAFPKAMKDAIGTLNSFLVQRAPKDPPPPRQSKRKSDDSGPELGEKPTKKKKGGKKSSVQVQEVMASQSEAFSNAAAQASISQTETLPESTGPEDSQEKSSSSHTKLKKKRELNVGGWISPPFASSVDRAWLDKNSPPRSFDPRTYAPQPGETVLYFPEGHRAFLSKYPDVLAGPRVTRMPLWERAKKEHAKALKEETQDNGANIESPSAKHWWNEEWISEVDPSLRRYPIICRVEKSVAEFAPDPYKEHKIKEGNQIIWKLPPVVTTNKSNKEAPLRLAVTLRPLTSVLPPKWTDSGPDDDDSLSPPPVFTAVTFPCSLQPFILPLAWSYIMNHSLSTGDEIPPPTKASQKGKVLGFGTIEGGFGSFRLDDDKIGYIPSVATALKASGETESVAGVSGRSNNAATISSQDGFVLSEFLSTFQDSANGIAQNGAGRQSVDPWNFIRSTLPLWNGVSIQRNEYDRKTQWTQFYDFRTKKTRVKNNDFFSPFLVAYLTTGVPRMLDDMLRMKLECSIEDLLRENNQLEIFRCPVTEEVAPAYNCAVPVSMCFERVLERLKERKTPTDAQPNCYYRTFEAIIADLNTIHDNCCLYNDPSSGLVFTASVEIPAAKKFLTSVASRHVKEKEEKIKAENEKKDFVLLHCNSSALLEADEPSHTAAKATGAKLLKYDPFRAPFKDPIYREWLQLTHPDASWRKDTKRPEQLFLQWVPQVGDTVLYSRSLHAHFVKGHYESLNTDQCAVPQFQRDDDSKENNPTNDGEKQETDDPLSGALEAGWIQGTITWREAKFPRPKISARSKTVGGKDVQTFETEASLLAIGLHFPGYELAQNKQPVVIHWRPCLYSFDMESPKDYESRCCKCCRVPVKSSFLCPTWANQFGGEALVDGPENVSKLVASSAANVQAPEGLSQEESASIERCLKLLKQRCLDSLPPDFVDIDLSNKSVKNGAVPTEAKVESRSLPDFDEILKVGDFGNPRTTKTKSTPSGVPRVHADSISKLSELNFLPPWLPQSRFVHGSGQNTLHETLSPCPRLCLELVLIRLKNGYYRHQYAIHGDLIESYCTSVLLCLAPSAKRKKNAISIKKLASALASKKYAKYSTSSGKASTGQASATGKKTKSPSKRKDSSNGTEKALPGSSKPDGGKEVGVVGQPQKEKKQKSPSNTLTDEETALLERLDKIRRLYAAAIVCILDTSRVQYLFGLTPLCVSKSTIPMTISLDQAPAALARETLVDLLSALGRDNCQNRYPKSPHPSPTVKLRIRCGEVLIKTETVVKVPPLKPPTAVAADVHLEKDTTTEVPKDANAPDQVVNDGKVDKPLSIQEAQPQTRQAPQSSALAVGPMNEKDIVQAKPKAAEDRVSDVAKSSEITVIRDSVDFEASDYENIPALTRLFFGKPGRNEACIRCQSRQIPMLACRVQKGHSNTDFDLMGIFRGMGGGLDGLFSILFQRSFDPMATPASGAKPQPVSSSTAAEKKAIKSETAAKGSSSIENNNIGKQDEGQDPGTGDSSFSTAKNPNKSEAQVPLKTGSTAANVSTENNLGNQDKGHNSATGDTDVITEKKAIKSEAEMQHDGDCSAAKDPSSTDKQDKEQDPRVLYEKAASAHRMAKELLSLARAYAEAPTRLSDEFIASNFPYDSNDGHYGFCIICGLSGDLLCCEGCANVAHPSCANLSGIPEGDWFCSAQCGKKEKRPKGNEMAGDTAGTRKDKTGEGGEPSHKNEIPNQSDVATFNEAVPPTISKMPPIVSFDEDKAEKLKEILDELSNLRRGSRKEKKQVPEETTTSTNTKVAQDEAATSRAEETPKEDVADAKKQPPIIGLGTRFVKRFGRHGLFQGEITSVPTETHPFFRAKYEDGDEEDLEENEITEYLERWGHKIGKTGKRNKGGNCSPPKSQDNPDMPSTKDSGAPKPVGKRPRGRPRKRPLEVPAPDSVQSVTEPTKKAKSAESAKDESNQGK